MPLRSLSPPKVKTALCGVAAASTRSGSAPVNSNSARILNENSRRSSLLRGRLALFYSSHSQNYKATALRIPLFSCLPAFHVCGHKIYLVTWKSGLAHRLFSRGQRKIACRVLYRCAIHRRKGRHHGRHRYAAFTRSILGSTVGRPVGERTLGIENKNSPSTSHPIFSQHGENLCFASHLCEKDP